MQAGDVLATYADVDDLIRDVGFKPTTPLEEGVRLFVDWYREHYRQTLQTKQAPVQGSRRCTAIPAVQ